MGAYLLSLSLIASVHTSADGSPGNTPAVDMPAVDSPAVDSPSGGSPSVDTPAEAAAPAAEKPQLIVLELEAIGVDEDQVRVITGRIADVLDREQSFVTLTSTDLAQLLDVAAERQTLGCDTDACIAELAAAYGARYVVYGRVAKVGELMLMQLSLFDSEAAKPVSRREIEGKSLRALLDATAGASKDLVIPLLPGYDARIGAADAGDGWAPGALFWVGGGVGAAGAATAAGLGVLAGYLYSQLITTGGSVPRSRKDLAQDTLPWVGLGAGAAGLVGILGAGVLAADFFVE